MNKYLEKLGVAPGKDKILHNLLTVPKKDKGVNMPRFQPIEPGLVQQADLLYLPDDKGYKFALVVVDTGSKHGDAEPLKGRSAQDVTNAFKTLYARGILKPPKLQIQVDAGSEFKGVTAKYFKDQHIAVRVAKTGRHRQQALVERRNQIIAVILFKRMSAEELITGEVSKDWVQDLPDVIKAINEVQTTNSAKVQKKLPDKPVCEGDSCKMLKIGTKVRVILETPLSVHGDQKLTGKFRSTDLRWAQKIRTIKSVSLKPNMPPLYLLDGEVSDLKIEPVGYTKNQLQVVPENEKYPDSEKVVRGNIYEKTWYPERLISKRKVNRKIEFEVKWRGVTKHTWEPRTSLIKQVPDLVKEFERNNP
jgi:hypothetical protein